MTIGANERGIRGPPVCPLTSARFKRSFAALFVVNKGKINSISTTAKIVIKVVKCTVSTRASVK